MVQLKGYRAVGGMHASIYNAMPIEGVKRLVEYMREFEAKRVTWISNGIRKRRGRTSASTGAESL